MVWALNLMYGSLGDLKAHLIDGRKEGAVLLPLKEVPQQLPQFAPVELRLTVAGEQRAVQATVLQAMPGVGLVVEVADASVAESWAADAGPGEGAPPEVTVVDPTADDPPAAEPAARKGVQRGTSALSWPIEKLQVEFPSLPTPEKIRLAKFGKRPARSLVLRSQDKTLHNFLLNNNSISGDEVAVLAGMPNADPALLKRIIGAPEWLRHTKVVRALVCNPRLTMPQVVKVLRHLPNDELRRLAKTGRVRAAVKREMVKFLDRGRL